MLLRMLKRGLEASGSVVSFASSTGGGEASVHGVGTVDNNDDNDDDAVALLRLLSTPALPTLLIEILLVASASP